jgi:hypothetical protein
VDVGAFHELIEESSLAFVVIDAPGEMGAKHPEGGTFLENFEVHPKSAADAWRELSMLVPDRLLPVKNAAIPRREAEQMLWALRHEVPAEVAEAEQIRR